MDPERSSVILSLELSEDGCLPVDSNRALLVGRVWSATDNGPCIVRIVDGDVVDITPHAPTMSALLEQPSPADWLRSLPAGRSLGSLADLLRSSEGRNAGRDLLLAPCDLQSIKACGVTFADSMLERVVEEKAMGDPRRASELRESIRSHIGEDLSGVQPGSGKAAELKTWLLERGMWSQYLEVGLGPDAEVFTKSQPLSAVGCGDDVGLHPSSKWNNPEPEVVLAVNSRGEIVGCTLGNDVNLRDIEGRSALLLGRAKDNNRSCAIGPFIRLLDETFGLDDVRRLQVSLSVRGEDGYELRASSDLGRISRDVADLVAQVIGRHHQYPDGFMLFTGTLYAPVEDRFEAGGGFTHLEGDVVSIASPPLGTLVNRVGYSDRLPPWEFGLGALFRNLAARGLLPAGP